MMSAILGNESEIWQIHGCDAMSHGCTCSVGPAAQSSVESLSSRLDSFYTAPSQRYHGALPLPAAGTAEQCAPCSGGAHAWHQAGRRRQHRQHGHRAVPSSPGRPLLYRNPSLQHSQQATLQRTQYSPTTPGSRRVDDTDDDNPVKLLDSRGRSRTSYPTRPSMQRCLGCDDGLCTLLPAAPARQPPPGARKATWEMAR